MMNIKDVEQYLQDAPNHIAGRDSSSMRQILACMKQEAVARNDQASAKYLWCLEKTLSIHDKFIEVFFDLKAGNFYNAWCILERIEIALHHLSPHFKDVTGKYYLAFIDEHIRSYQSLFPYAMFYSPEYIAVAKYCTICGQKVSFRNFCGHRTGEIYNGEMCGREIREVTSFGISLVPNPRQKYSVVFKTSGDHYNYRLVTYLMDKLISPFDAWSVSVEKRRHPHSFFKHLGRNDQCPCESGKKYKQCCLKEIGVMRLHYQFEFSVPPPQGLSDIEYVY